MSAQTYHKSAICVHGRVSRLLVCAHTCSLTASTINSTPDVVIEEAPFLLANMLARSAMLNAARCASRPMAARPAAWAPMVCRGFAEDAVATTQGPSPHADFSESLEGRRETRGTGQPSPACAAQCCRARAHIGCRCVRREEHCCHRHHQGTRTASRERSCFVCSGCAGALSGAAHVSSLPPCRTLAALDCSRPCLRPWRPRSLELSVLWPRDQDRCNRS